MRAIDLFDQGAALDSGHVALIDGARSLSFGQVQRQTQRIAQALHGAGLRTGDKVAIYADNGIDPYLCVLGVLRAGLVWLPVNPRDSVAATARQLAQFDCDWLFVDDAHADCSAELRSSAPRLRGVVAADGAALQHWVEENDHGQPIPPFGAQALAAIFATGGTTGKPRGVMMTQANVVAFCGAEPMPEDAAAVHLMAAPMTHVAGRLALAALAQGATVVVQAGAEPRAVLDAITSHRISHLFLPPTAIYALLATPGVGEHDFSSLRHFGYGGAPMSVAQLKEAIKVFGPVMTQGYGQTEAPMRIARLSQADHFRNGVLGGELADDGRLASCGRPTPAVTVAIMDEQGGLLAPGGRGEVVLRGDIVTAGYYKDPEATAHASRFGWHHTGDIGWLDDEGYLYIVDRIKDMIISGGFNVYSAEVEQALMALGGLQDCAVLGLPDAHWGETVVAVVQPMPGASIDLADLQARARAALGGVKAPKRIWARAQLPRSAAGKVLKRELRTELVAAGLAAPEKQA